MSFVSRLLPVAYVTDGVWGQLSALSPGNLMPGRRNLTGPAGAESRGGGGGGEEEEESSLTYS